MNNLNRFNFNGLNITGFILAIILIIILLFLDSKVLDEVFNAVGVIALMLNLYLEDGFVRVLNKPQEIVEDLIEKYKNRNNN